MYTFNTSQGPPIAQSVQFNLKQIGIDVEIKLFDRVVQHEKTATRGEPFDLTLEGWLADYPDPANFINVLLDGRRIQADNNVNASVLQQPDVQREDGQGVRQLAGDARANAYAILDRDIMNDQAPVAPYISTNRSLAHQHEGRVLPVLRRPGHPADPDLHEVGSRETTSIDRSTAGGAQLPPPTSTGHRIRLPSRRRDAIPHQTAPLGLRPVPRRHVRHLRDLLPRPGEPRAARGRPVGDAASGSTRSRSSSASTSRSTSSTRSSSSAWCSRARSGSRSSTRQSVNEEILRAAPITASLVFGAMIMVLSIAIPLGIFSALRPRSLLDRAAMVYVLIGISLPSFWIGLVLSYVVGYKLGLTPIARLLRGRSACPRPPPAAGSWDWAYHMILPVPDARDRGGRHLCPVRPRRGDGDADHGLRAHRARQGRARAHGDPLARAAERDAPGRDDGRDGHRPPARRRDLHRGVFGLNGLGGTALESIGRFDLPVLQGVVIFGAVAIIIFSLIVDLLYAWIDPRIRLT